MGVENANTRTAHKFLKNFSDTDLIQQKIISQLDSESEQQSVAWKNSMKSMRQSVKNCHFITLRNFVFPRRMQTTDGHKNGQNTYSPKVIVHVVCAEPCYYKNLILLYFYSEPNSVRPRSFWSPSYIYSLCVLCICHFLYFAAEKKQYCICMETQTANEKRAFLAILASLHKTSHLHGNSTDQLIMDI